MTKIKICGITNEEALAATENAGADFVGFVFHAKSARNIDIQNAANLARKTRLISVGLFVDPNDETWRRVLAHVPLDMIQLHGAETPARVAAIKSMTGLPVMKVIPVATKDDLTSVPAYEAVADWLLFDTKKIGVHGGSGQAFDWSILNGFKIQKPWMLAGGLTPENAGTALAKLKPTAVDVSSGVESSRGVKDACKIAAFVETIRHGTHS